MLPGRLTRWKGQVVLIEALAMLGRRDLRCLLVGSDQGREAYTEELKALVVRRGLTDIVHIVGECNDMPAAYMLTDVVVSASTDPEAFGRVIVEAQAMGRPVVATDNGAGRENVLDGQTGLLVRGERSGGAGRGARPRPGHRSRRAGGAGRRGDRIRPRQFHPGTDVRAHPRRLCRGVGGETGETEAVWAGKNASW